MAIQIGLLIKKVLKEKSMTSIDLGKLINRHPKTVASILKRKALDTELLTAICKALNYDFVEHLYEEEPLKSLMNTQVQKRDLEIVKLKSDIIQKDQLINTQQDVIRLLKEKEQFLKLP